MRFGTDGVRGPAGVAPIDEAGAWKIGNAAAWWSSQQGVPLVFVGRDPRPSGAALAEAVVRGAIAAGAQVVDLGVASTPVVGHAQGETLAAGRAATAVIVTASHNPARDNGFKVLGPTGRKPDDAAAAVLESAFDAPAFAPGGTVRHAGDAAQAAYAAALADRLGVLKGLAGRRVVIDLAAGAASRSRLWLRSLLHEVDVRFIGVAGEVNGGCGSEHPEGLAEAVVACGADAGLAVDGDADRALLVDATGRVVPGDSLLGLLTASIAPARVAVSLMSTAAFEGWFPGVRVERTPVGDRHLADAVLDRGAGLGGEESGHVVLASAWPHADGLLVGLLALDHALRDGRSLDEALAPYTPWPRRAGKVRSPTRQPLERLPRVVEAIVRAEAMVAPGRSVVRWSGTEPVLRVMVEGPDAATVDAAFLALHSQCVEALA